MKKLLWLFLFCLFLFSIIPTVLGTETVLKIELEPKSCSLGGCPTDLDGIYPAGEKCVGDLETFKEDPLNNHFWINDPEVTTQGKADERARQFISWAMNKNAVDDHPVLKSIWNNTRNVAYFLTILVAAILGLAIIVGRRTGFDFKIGIWPAIGKIVASLLYITFSAAIVLLLIQLSEILMKFFAESLGSKDLFNIYFTKSTTVERNYLDLVGCRDLNFKVQEAAKMEILLLKLTNVTYYVMGSMLILRKIILWFMLFLSPFLAILFSFAFIKNIGWIWIGVFFQWLFYGPLFSIFLGGLTAIWKAGIPFAFDFSRAGKPSGYIYPTAINILYGGPAQQLSTLNNGNYIDTFVEYIITLIMLWAVTFFPWWLLRNFRDYCCDGINAAKNILMSMYDAIRGNSSPVSPTQPLTQLISAKLKIPREVEIPIRIKLETIEEIKKTKTENIVQSLNLSASKLTDVAHFETNKQTREAVNKNLSYLTNPIKAETPVERQKFMNIKTELFNRANKEDRVAKQILSVTSTSNLEKIQAKTQILKTIPRQTVSADQKSLPVEKIISIPPTVSLEDYEQVKKMWAEQYEKGEVPVTENITSRHEWVDQDVVFITNTLNKLMSSEEKIKSEGLDDLAYILPIFLINNLKGEELFAYLKAKLEAAKTVQENLQREKDITSRLKAASEEEQVEVLKPKVKEAEKTMEMKKELKS